MEVEAVVVELLPQETYRVRLPDEQQVIVHATAATKANFVRVRPGDQVRVAISPHDPGRGRIVELLKKG